MNRRIFLALAFLGSCYLLLDGIATPIVGIRINSTDSMPYTLLLSRKGVDSPTKGMLVSFRHPKSIERLLKEVVGLSGDAIENLEGHILVDGRDCGTPVRESSLTAVDPGAIPEGYVYVYAPHPESFDSRYREFGLVAEDDLEEVLWPLF